MPPIPPCQHIDNWSRCKLHTAPRWRRWLLPKDGELLDQCGDFKVLAVFAPLPRSDCF